MKRLSLSACALFFLLSCTRAGTLPPADVLQKATDATQTLQSAAFTIDMDINGHTDLVDGTWDGNGHINGTMTNAGKQVQFSLSAKGKQIDASNDEYNYTLSSDFIIAGEKEVYIKLHTFDITPPGRLLPPELLTRLLNQWWLIPGSTDDGTNAADIAADPTLLKMQTSVIAVTKDKGLSSVNGHSAYKYDVTIDPVKLQSYLEEVAKKQGKELGAEALLLKDMNATGTVWIDDSSFVIHRIVWTITSTNAKKPFTLHLDANISNHNKPMTISLPADAAPFPGTSGSAIFSPDDSSASMTPSTR